MALEKYNTSASVCSLRKLFNTKVDNLENLVKLKNCFVIMPIGDQEMVGDKVSSSDLKERYVI